LSQTATWATFVAATSVAAADKITGFGNGDSLAIAGSYNIGTDAVAGAAALGANTAAGYALIAGLYDATTDTFIAGASSATNNDFVIQWADGTSVHSVVLVDAYTGTGTYSLSATAATDLLSFNIV
jgi:hypothetical protein